MPEDFGKYYVILLYIGMISIIQVITNKILKGIVTMKNIKIHRILALLTLLILLMSSLTFVVNADTLSIKSEELATEDAITINDAIFIFRFLTGKIVADDDNEMKEIINTYDYNSDGEVDINDALLIFRYLAGKLELQKPALPAKYSMIYRDDILEGTEIDFDVNYSRIFNIYEKSYIATVVKSMSDLNKLFADGDDIADRYNEEFFKENALIYFNIAYGSGSIRTKIPSIIKNDNELCFNIEILFPESGGGTDDMKYDYYNIEMKKENIIGFNTISYFETYGTY